MITCGTEGGRSNVYFCFNRDDYESVATIATAWRAGWVDLSIDEGQTTQSAIWGDSIRCALADAQIAILFLGPNGISSTQEMEIDQILPRWSRRELLALVAILPECPKNVSAPERLRGVRIVDFRNREVGDMLSVIREFLEESKAAGPQVYPETELESDSDRDIGPMDTEGLIGIEDINEFMVDLRGMARRLLGGDKNAASVRATALIMSALVRSKRHGQNWTELTWANREHFFAVMHREMRRSLIDHSRKRNAARRPNRSPTDPMDFDLYDLPGTAKDRPEVIIALEDAIAWLEEFDNDMADHIKHHYFSGMSVIEMSSFFDVSEKTVKRKLSHARILLHERIEEILRNSAKASWDPGPKESEPPDDVADASTETGDCANDDTENPEENEDSGDLENPS